MQSKVLALAAVIEPRNALTLMAINFWWPGEREGASEHAARQGPKTRCPMSAGRES